MQRYQSHKIVEAGKILEFNHDPEGSFTVVLEDATDVVLIPETGERIRQMATEAGTIVNGGYLVSYPDGYISWHPADFLEHYDLVQPSSGKSNIKGYRELNAEEVGYMNEVKELAETVGQKVEQMMDDVSCDTRWVSIGKTHLQQGFMALVRSIAKPDFF